VAWRYTEPGKPVDLNVPDGEQVYHAELFFAGLERPIHMDVSAADQAQARERLIDGCRRLIAGVTHPPAVVVHELDDWLAR
jgi:hypothetical protein